MVYVITGMMFGSCVTLIFMSMLNLSQNEDNQLESFFYNK